METAHGESSEMINLETVCRICAEQLDKSDKLINFYDPQGLSNDLVTKINTYLPIRVTESDELPLHCCLGCATTIIMWHDLVQAAVRSDRKLHSALEDRTITRIEYNDDDGDTPEEDTPEISAPTFDSDSDDPKPVQEAQIKLEINPNPPKIEPAKSNSRVITEPFESVANLQEKKCLKCPDLTFRTRTSLKEHVWKTHDVKCTRKRRRRDEIERRFFCDTCRKGFTRKFDMEKHRKNAHPNAAETTQASGVDRERAENRAVMRGCRVANPAGGWFYKCDVCGRNFKMSYHLMRHRSVHTGARAFFCHVCAGSFRTATGLKRHLSDRHYGVRAHACGRCGRRFASKAGRDEHANTHTGDRPFVCDRCGKAFRQRASLRVHGLFHSEVRPFACELCDKRFRRARDLKVHGWLHTGHKPYGCGQCGSAFRLSQELKRHKKCHENAGDLACPVCGSVFKQERYLKGHMKVHKGHGPITVKEEQAM